MFKLKKAVINKYKSYMQPQTVRLEEDITALVGKNESGKTACLEALAKLNYFSEDENFLFDEVQDYPRSELKQYQRSGDKVDPIVCTFEIDVDTLKCINEDLGKGVLKTTEFRVSSRYGAGRIWYLLNCDEKKFLDLEGVFIQIGLIPNTDWLKGVLDLSQYGEIKINDHGETSLPGVFAAGDVTTVPYKQIIIAMGEGSKSALGAFDYLIRH